MYEEGLPGPKHFFTYEKLDLRHCITTDDKIKEGVRKPCLAFDFETFQGYGMLICDSKARSICTLNGRDIFDFLLKKDYQDTFNFFYNVKFDFQALIKHLPLWAYTRLYEKQDVTLRGYFQNGHDLRIQYIPGKLFTLTRKNSARSGKSYVKTTFYDIAQFYEMSLEKAGKLYSKRRKLGDYIDAEKLGTSFLYWKQNFWRVLVYCIRDCRVTQDLAERVQDTVFDRLGFYPSSYSSKASVAVEYTRRECKVPVITKLPASIINMAIRSYHGGWFECMARGRFEKLYNYDINSAYPFAIRDLIDINEGEWRHTRDVSQEAYYGLYEVDVEVPDDENLIPPLAFKRTQTETIRPCGNFRTTINKLEYEAYKDCVTFKVYRGWEFFPSRIIKPFEKVIETLYRWKKELSKESYEYLFVKKIMNSLYGKMYEKIKDRKTGKYRAGILFNPIYADIITSKCQIQLWEAMMQKPQDIVMCATDGILSQSPLDLPQSDELGDWSFEGCDTGIVFQSGVYQVGDQYKQRGVKKGRIRVKNDSGGYDTYEHLLELIRKYPERDTYSYTVKKPIQYGETVRHRKLSKRDLNIFDMVPMSGNINMDRKRYYGDTFKNGSDLLSRAIYGRPFSI
ncbi:MAG: DNA polymerase [Halobacteriota archaeon]|nr:DNA polymerase [Halobacteriota archaeon]